MTGDAPAYDYSALSTPRTIRVLHVWGAKDDKDKVICSIKQQSLNDAPCYNALSYTWGGQALDRHIIIRGDDDDEQTWRLMVTENCEDALMAMRPDDITQNFPIWVDAISIDQSNIKERNQQVSIMHEIYEMATKINIWLGKSSELSDMFFAKLYTLSEVWQSLDSDGLMVENPVMEAAIRHLNIVPELREIQTRPYWTRVWTLQEVVLGRSHLIHCGPMTCAFPQAFLHLGSDSGTTAYNARHNLFLDMYLYKYGQREGWDEQLSSEQWFQGPDTPLLTAMALVSSDPRDKVFGLRYVFPDVYGCFPVDYSRDVAKLYTDVMTKQLKKRQSLEPLALVSPLYRNKDLGLPSWVPDLSGTASHVHLTLHDRHPWNSSRARATNHSDKAENQRYPGSKCETFQFVGDGKILRVQGVKLDEISRCVDSFSRSFVQKCSYPGEAQQLAELMLSADMLDCMRVLRQVVQEGDHQNSHPLTVIECLIYWERNHPVREKGYKAINESDGALAILLAGVHDCHSTLKAVDETTASDLKQHEQDRQRAQEEVQWPEQDQQGQPPTSNKAISAGVGAVEATALASSLSARAELLRPDTVEALIRLSLMMREKDFLAVVIMTLVPFYGGKRLFETASGQIGYGDATVQPGDSIYLVDGMNMPVVARRCSETTLHFGGWAYVEGMMLGEAWPGNVEALQTVDFV